MNESYIKCPLFPVSEMYINCRGPERRSSVLTSLPLSRVSYNWLCPLRKCEGSQDYLYSSCDFPFLREGTSGGWGVPTKSVLKLLRSWNLLHLCPERIQLITGW